MADPSPLCALAYLSFLSFMSHHGDPTAYAQSYDFAMFIAKPATSPIGSHVRWPQRRGRTDH